MPAMYGHPLAHALFRLFLMMAPTVFEASFPFGGVASICDTICTIVDCVGLVSFALTMVATHAV